MDTMADRLHKKLDTWKTSEEVSGKIHLPSWIDRSS